MTLEVQSLALRYAALERLETGFEDLPEFHVDLDAAEIRTVLPGSRSEWRTTFHILIRSIYECLPTGTGHCGLGTACRTCQHDLAVVEGSV